MTSKHLDQEGSTNNTMSRPSTSLQGANSSPVDNRKLYVLQNIPVYFPHPAYPSQLSSIEKLLSALNSRSNCLLESPTGSGKSLTLLSASLSWQKEYKLSKKKNLISSGSGGSGVEGDPSSSKRFKILLDHEQLETTTRMSDWFPKIYFCTRTHKQIKQLTAELDKLRYRDVNMSILSSRDHTCVHPQISEPHVLNKNEECEALLKTARGCEYFKNYRSLTTRFVRRHLLSDWGNKFAWDIEDVVKLGSKETICPYFGLQVLSKDADIVFCPYNYLIDPMIRENLEINLDSHVIIFDEGHNIEDIAREAYSFSVTLKVLKDILDNLEKLSDVFIDDIDNQDYLKNIQYLLNITSKMCTWIHKLIASNSSTKRLGGGTYRSYLDKDFLEVTIPGGMEFVSLMSELSLGPNNIHLLDVCLYEMREKKLDNDRLRVTSICTFTFEKLCFILRGIYRNDFKYLPDYRFVMTKTYSNNTTATTTESLLDQDNFVDPYTSNSTHQYKKRQDYEIYTVNFWCMNAGVCFADFQDVHSLIVTSGTLCPMIPFQTELSLKFPIIHEADHVIESSQIWVASISCGRNNYPLKAVYQNVSDINFQDELGQVILEICQIVPHGVLCFLPSYSLMGKLLSRWQVTNQLDEFKKYKPLVVSESRDKFVFDQTLTEYYSHIKQGQGGGALMFAVYRGKVSEGLNFSDNNARAVITVGIPYPNLKDIQLNLKKEYNNAKQHSSDYPEDEKHMKLLNGYEWYNIQAFKALNQALGRCIRHKKDWGALILIDERFKNNSKCIKSLSKWIRRSIKHYNEFDVFCKTLKTFVESFDHDEEKQ